MSSYFVIKGKQLSFVPSKLLSYYITKYFKQKKSTSNSDNCMIFMLLGLPHAYYLTVLSVEETRSKPELMSYVKVASDEIKKRPT